jgi:hypothetical protein
MSIVEMRPPAGRWFWAWTGSAATNQMMALIERVALSAEAETNPSRPRPAST